MIDELIKKYSEFVTHHPYLVLIIVILVSSYAAQMAGTIQTKTSKIKEFLPPYVESIRTLNIVENDFGSTDTIFFAVEIDPLYKGSDEVRDVRDPRVIRYINLLSERALHTDDVIEVTSEASVLKDVNGRLPQSINDVQLIDKTGLLDNYVSQDHTLAIANIRAADDADMKVLEIELNKIIMEIPKPPGIVTALGGTAVEDLALEKTVGPDMGKTSMYSLVGILAIILLLFGSAKYGFTPLTTIVFGSLWALGFAGLIGMKLSSTTSGVLSMIMGIGIDFGIQVVTRYRLELPGKTPGAAMAVSLNNVIIPMSTTTLAALIGFQAMALGKLTFLKDMGNLMSYGVVACMIAGITIVPALIVIFDTINLKDVYNKLMKIFEVRT